MIKLVVADIDNTLVPKHQPVSERTRNDILKLQEKGILFGLASGRNVVQLNTLQQQWQIKSDILIGLNGSELFDGISNYTKLYYQLQPDQIKQALEIMHPFDCIPTVFKKEVSYVGKIDQRIKDAQKYLKDNTVILVKNEEEFYKEPIPKMCFRIKQEDWPAIEKRLQSYHLEGFKAFRTEFTMLEFCHEKASKGALLTKFCQDHNIDLKDVASFGDMTNDVSMLEISGMSVCLLNGSDDAKKASKYITDHDVDHEGFADFVEKHILSEV